MGEIDFFYKFFCKFVKEIYILTILFRTSLKKIFLLSYQTIDGLIKNYKYN